MNTGIESFLEELRQSGDNQVVEVCFTGTTITGLMRLECLMKSNENVSIPEKELTVMKRALFLGNWEHSMNRIFHIGGCRNANQSWFRHIMEGVDDAKIVFA